MVVKAIIDKTKVLGDGKCTIFIYIYDKDRKQKKTIATDYRIEPKFWGEGKALKAYPEYQHLNSLISEKVLFYEKEFLRNVGTINEVLTKDQKISFGEFLSGYKSSIDKSVSVKGQPLSAAYVKSIKNSISITEKFLAEKPHDWNQLTEVFYQSFVTWLRAEKNYGENSIGRVVNDLKKILKGARKKKLHDLTEYEDFAATRSETYAIALSEAEINQMMSVELPDNLQVEADRFYVSYNFLLRFTDSISIDERDIIKEGGKYLLSTVPSKTKNRVIVPFLPKTYDILKKYNFSFPKTTNQHSNRKIKDVARIAGLTEPVTLSILKQGKILKKSIPKCDLITTHTARRSMATNLLLNGFNLPEIMLLGGWTSLSSLQKYLKVDKMDNAIKAADRPFFNR